MSEPTAPASLGALEAPAAPRGPARRPARGMLVLTVANGLYIASGYVITVWLAHRLGPEDFGRYGVVTAVVTLVNIAVARGVPVETTRAIAAEPEARDRTMAVAAHVMVPLIVVIGALATAAAIPLASALGDDRLRVPLLVGAFAALTYGLQALPLAWFAGTHRHGWQAVALGWYAVSRLAAIIAGGLLGGLVGAIAGFVAAPAIATLATLAAFLVLRGRRVTVARLHPGNVPATSARALLRASAPVVGIAALVSLCLSVDLLAFKSVGAAADAGRYAAAAAIAHVPFFLLRSAPIVLLPSVAAARAATPPIEKYTRYAPVQNEIRSGVGDALVLLALPTALLVTLGDRALELVFGSRYAGDDLVVAPLALATAAVTLYAVLVAVDTALGTLRNALVVGLLGAAAIAAAAAIGGQGSNASRAAWAVAIAAIATVVAHATVAWIRVGPFVPTRAIAAVALAGVVAAPTLATPAGTWWFVASATAACAAYAAIALGAGLVRFR